jgi:hypothetical protein
MLITIGCALAAMLEVGGTSDRPSLWHPTKASEPAPTAATNHRVLFVMVKTLRSLTWENPFRTSQRRRQRSSKPPN